MTGPSGFLRVLVVILIALGAGLVGYQLGLSQNVAVEGGRVVGYPGWGGWGFGWGFGGFFFFLLVLFLLFAAFRPRWGGPPRDWYGRSDWSGNVPPRFEDWHRRAHEGRDAANG